jgi:hypothetical protein
MSDDLTIELGARDVNLEGLVDLENIHRRSLSTLVENLRHYFSLSYPYHISQKGTCHEIFYTHDIGQLLCSNVCHDGIHAEVVAGRSQLSSFATLIRFSIKNGRFWDKGF